MDEISASNPALAVAPSTDSGGASPSNIARDRTNQPGEPAQNNDDPIEILPASPTDGSKSDTYPWVEVHEKKRDFRARLFAKKRELSWWFPQIESDENKSWRIWFSKRSRALLMNTSVVSAILTANISLTVFATTQYGSQDGVGTIYQGTCDTVQKLDLWLHLLINFLGTGMLSASNYCMQLQAAPTRENVDRAHQTGKWLDIGVPSLRNIWYIGNWRRFSWILLALSSVPIHLIYNSAVFQSLASNDYTVAVVNNNFLKGDGWDLTAADARRQGDPAWAESRVNPPYFNYPEIIHGMQQGAKNGSYQKQNISACFDTYNDYWRAQGNVVVLVKNLTVQASTNDTLLIYVSVIPRSDDWAKNMWALGNGTGQFVAVPPQTPVALWFLGPPHYEVDSCLVQMPNLTTQRCNFEYSPQIMAVVCILNLTKALVMICIWSMRKWQSKEYRNIEKDVLYTLGDAIASFMRKPDPTTENMCLAPKYDFVSRRTLKNRFVKELPTPSQEPREWREIRRRWMAAASYRRWFNLIFMCGLVLLVAALLLGTSLPSLRHRQFPTSIPDLWSLGFGALTPFTYIVLGLPRTDPAGLIANVLIANLPQLIFSILYIFYNSMLSCFLVQLEFSRMYKIRKPLRVSEPTGIQRSSYFISLPLRFGIPFYITSGIMHWLISQSLFLARITALFPDGTVDRNSSFSTCGYSPIAIFITILVGATLVLAVVFIGLVKYDGTMAMAATNSRAISAACHALPEDRDSGYLLPVQWGVVEMHDGVGKCTFTTAPAHEMRLPEPGFRYA